MICGRIKPTTSPYGYSSFRKEENWEFRVPTFLLDYCGRCTQRPYNSIFIN